MEVNFGGQSPDRISEQRAHMWHRMKEWLDGGPERDTILEIGSDWSDSTSTARINS